MAAERLQKVLARAGVASRRHAEGLILDGRVTVDGRPARVGESVDPSHQRVAVDGLPLAPPPPAVHFAVHKPAGMLSSAHDERGRRSVVRLIPNPPARLWPAGRLDADSEGLLVLTNDGEWANRVVHPRRGHVREYAALVDRAPDRRTLALLTAGVELEDGPARFLGAWPGPPPAEVRRAAGEGGTWLRVEIGEGRKREVRRLLAGVGITVVRLVRVRFGPLRLTGLRSGEWRALDADEIAALEGARPRRGPVVAIDGPSGAGKSTVGHALARRIGATFVDTGLLYRALTVAAVERGTDPDDGRGLGELALNVSIRVGSPPPNGERRETVLLDGRDVSGIVRTPRIDNLVSAVSRHAEVRRAMLEVQRAAARDGNAVLVGRDIGTVVLPDADLKVFLVASAEVRAARRAAEMGQPERLDAYLAEIRERDERDSSRPVAPLRQAADALVLDTGALDVAACVEAIVAALEASG